jgi:hypothetical protein
MVATPTTGFDAFGGRNVLVLVEAGSVRHAAATSAASPYCGFMRLTKRGTTDAARTRRFVESHREGWQGVRALYREGAGFSLVKLGDRIETAQRGLTATCLLLPTPGFTARPVQWTIFLSWEASTFTPVSWHNPYVPMTVWFDPSLIDATVRFVAQLYTCDAGMDPVAVRNFVNNFPRMSTEQKDGLGANLDLDR